jgi:hypothetical protein
LGATRRRRLATFFEHTRVNRKPLLLGFRRAVFQALIFTLLVAIDAIEEAVPNIQTT